MEELHRNKTSRCLSRPRALHAGMLSCWDKGTSSQRLQGSRWCSWGRPRKDAQRLQRGSSTSETKCSCNCQSIVDS